MSKISSKLPDEIEERLQQLVDRFAAQLRQEVAEMFSLANVRGTKEIARDIAAARIVLEENESPMYRDDLVKELMRRGVSRPKGGSAGSTPESEMRRTIGRAASHRKNLMLFQPPPGFPVTEKQRAIVKFLKIGLPEWSDKAFDGWTAVHEEAQVDYDPGAAE